MTTLHHYLVFNVIMLCLQNLQRQILESWFNRAENKNADSKTSDCIDVCLDSKVKSQALDSINLSLESTTLDSNYLVSHHGDSFDSLDFQVLESAISESINLYLDSQSLESFSHLYLDSIDSMQKEVK